MALSFEGILQGLLRVAARLATPTAAPAKAAGAARPGGTRPGGAALRAREAEIARAERSAQRQSEREAATAKRQEARREKETQREAAKGERAKAREALLAERAEKKALAARGREMKLAGDRRQRKLEAEERELDAKARRAAVESDRGDRKAARLKAFAESGKTRPALPAAPTAPAAPAAPVAPGERKPRASRAVKAAAGVPESSTYRKAVAASDRATAHTARAPKEPDADYEKAGHRLHSQAAALHYREAKAARAAGQGRLAASHTKLAKQHTASAELAKQRYWATGAHLPRSLGGTGPEQREARMLKRGKKGGTYYVTAAGRKVYVH